MPEQLQIQGEKFTGWGCYLSDRKPKKEMSPEEEEQRLEFLQQLEDWLRMPIIILGFMWLVLLVVDLIRGLNPFLQSVVYAIWAIFVFDFILRFVLAPRKLRYLRKNWLTALSLFLPALSVFRIFAVFRALQALRATSGLRFVAVIGSLNRGMHTLRSTLGRSGFNYVAALTTIVLFVGAAGMYAFENHPQGLNTYGDSLWFTAMLLTTIGSGYSPVSGAGRLLTLIISLYSFAVFSYITATLASFLIGKSTNAPESNLASETSIQALRKEIASLKAELINRNSSEEPPAT